MNATNGYSSNTTLTLSTYFSYISSTTSDISGKKTEINADTILGVLAVFYMIIGIPFNSISFSYFFAKSRNSTSTFLYLCINAVDGVICLLMLPVSVASFRNDDSIMFDNVIFCNLWSIIWNVGTRLSVYIIAVLSIARTISVFSPLSHLSRRKVVLIVAIYTIVISLQQTLPYWYKVVAAYCKHCVSCTWDFARIYTYGSLGHKICVIVFVQFEYLIPALVIFISGILLCVRLGLYRRNRIIKSKSTANSHATMTIITLTIAFFIFNAPFLLVLQLSTIHALTNNRITAIWDKYLDVQQRILISKIYSTHLVVINSCINPVIYLARIQEFRTYAKQLLFCSSVNTLPNQQSYITLKRLNGRTTRKTLRF